MGFVFVVLSMHYQVAIAQHDRVTLIFVAQFPSESRADFGKCTRMQPPEGYPRGRARGARHAHKRAARWVTRYPEKAVPPHVQC